MSPASASAGANTIAPATPCANLEEDLCEHERGELQAEHLGALPEALVDDLPEGGKEGDANRHEKGDDAEREHRIEQVPARPVEDGEAGRAVPGLRWGDVGVADERGDKQEADCRGRRRKVEGGVEAGYGTDRERVRARADDGPGGDRSGAEAHQPERVIGPHVAAAVALRGQVVDERDRGRDDERAGDPLEGPEDQQVPVGRRERVRETRRTEDAQPDEHEDLPAAGAVGEPARERLQRAVNEAKQREHDAGERHLGQPERRPGDELAGDEKRQYDDQKGVTDRLRHPRERQCQHLPVNPEQVSHRRGCTSSLSILPGSVRR
jgi:hypothetical protein